MLGPAYLPPDHRIGNDSAVGQTMLIGTNSFCQPDMNQVPDTGGALGKAALASAIVAK